MVMAIAAGLLRLIADIFIGLFGTAIVPGRSTIMKGRGIIPVHHRIRM